MNVVSRWAALVLLSAIALVASVTITCGDGGEAADDSMPTTTAANL